MNAQGKYYYIVYSRLSGADLRLNNRAIADIHPFIWVAKTNDRDDADDYYTLVSWKEISKEEYEFATNNSL